MNCQHTRVLPNPAGGAWFCADCGAYPLICSPETKADISDCAAIIQKLWRDRDDLRSELAWQKRMRDLCTST